MSQTDDFLSRFTQLHSKLIDLSLGRIERLLARIGDPHLRLPPVIHVAGTNGKGSTVAFMRAILEAAGKRVHVYTSPHLVRFNERIRLAGKLVDDATLAAAFELCERANAGEPITVFEITSAAAFHLFSTQPADYLLLEVGLGGRFDTTNVVASPLACVVTPVSIDHPEFLGADVATIAGEKAGIIKPGAAVVLALQNDVALRVLERAAARHRIRPVVGGQDFSGREENGRFVFEDASGLVDLPLPRLGGRHQLINAATAIATLRAVAPGLPQEAYEKGMLSVQWPARMQRLSRGALAKLAPAGAELWLDGGHNEDGGRVLAEAMADLETQAPRPLVMLCGTLKTKDSAAFLRPFKGLVQEIIAVPVPGEHASRPAEEIARMAREAGIEAACCEGFEAALRFLAARTWREPPRILIAGSLYLAGEVLRADGTAVE